MIFLAEATLRKHRGGRSYIAFKFSFTGNRFVLEAGIILLLLNTRYSEIHIFQSPYCFFSEDEVMFVFCLPGRYGEIIPYFHEFTVFIITY